MLSLGSMAASAYGTTVRQALLSYAQWSGSPHPATCLDQTMCTGTVRWGATLRHSLDAAGSITRRSSGTLTLTSCSSWPSLRKPHNTGRYEQGG